MHRMLVAVLAVVLWAKPACGQDESFVSQGNLRLSLGGALSSNAVAVGGSFGYFVVDRVMPGVSYEYAHQTGERSDWSASQHDATVFLRYYLISSGSLYPFVMVGGGWTGYSQSGRDVAAVDASLWSVMGGGGLVAFLSRHFAVEVLLGARRYLSLPSEVDDAGLEQTGFMWTLGFGLYL